MHTYSVAVNLHAGQTYTVADQRGIVRADLGHAVGAGARHLTAAVAAAKSAKTAVVVVSDDTESEATDRLSLNLPSAQDELISAVAAANPHTVVVINAGAPVAMPWLNQVAGVRRRLVPGPDQRHRAGSVLFGQSRPERAPAGDVPGQPGPGAGLDHRRSSRANGPGPVLRGPRRRLPVVRHEEHRRRCSRSATACRTLVQVPATCRSARGRPGRRHDVHVSAHRHQHRCTGPAPTSPSCTWATRPRAVSRHGSSTGSAGQPPAPGSPTGCVSR